MTRLPRWLLSLDHAEYLKSATWKRVRMVAIDRAAGHCEQCQRETKRMQVHHLTYARVGGAELPGVVGGEAWGEGSQARRGR